MINHKTIPFIALSLLIVLACTCPLTLENAQPTSPGVIPTAQIIYRSPSDMNIQAEDVPDLKEKEPETSLEEMLLPEALDQDQNVYVNVEETIVIESLVIQVTEVTTRSYTDVFDEVVTRRRPGAKRVGEVRKVQVGDHGWVISYTDSTCVSGLVLILYRQNMIVVLIGCGPALTETILVDIAVRIDERILPPKVIVDENLDCVRLKLTAEECANAGRHTYVTRETSTTGGCEPVPNYRCTQTHEFSENSLIIRAHTCDYEGFAVADTVYEKTGLNTYFKEGCDTVEAETYWDCANTVTFDQHGYTFRVIIESQREGVEGCINDYEAIRE